MSKPNDVILTQEMSTIDYSKYKKLGLESETIKKSQIKVIKCLNLTELVPEC